MKVLMLTRDFPPMLGGIAVFLENLCLGLTHLGHQVEVLALRKESHEDCARFDEMQPYAVHRFETSRILSGLTPVLYTWRYTRYFVPDVLFLGHVMSTHGVGAVLAKKLLGLPYVVLSHGADLGHGTVSRMDNWSMSKLLHNANLVLANSRYTADALKGSGVETSRIHFLHPGVNPTIFTPELLASKVRPIRERFKLGDGPVILTVGRLVERKNHATVLYTLKIVSQRINNVRYLIVGDGPEKVKLEKLTQQLNLERHVIFAGEIADDELPKVYAVSDLFIMPSIVTQDNFEGFGIVFVEANACGKPVIGGRTGGINDSVVDGVTGLLVDPLSVDEIVVAIMRLLTDKEYARQLGENGRKRALQEFSWDKVTERLEYSLRSTVGL